MDDDVTKLFVGAIVLFGAIALLIVAAHVLIPIVAVAGAWKAYRWYATLPPKPDSTARIVGEAQKALTRANFPEAGEFLGSHCDRLIGSWGGRPLAYPLYMAMGQMSVALYEAEELSNPLVPLATGNPIEEGRYRDYIAARMAKIADPDRTLNLLHTTLAGSHAALEAHLPPMARVAFDRFNGEVEAPTVPVLDIVDDAGAAVGDAIAPFFQEEVVERRLFAGLRRQLEHNVHVMSGVEAPAPAHKLVFPGRHKGPPKEIVRGYLAQTPLLPVFEARVPFLLPDRARSEAQWIVAPPGTGKTQALQAQLVGDIAKAIAGEASVVVIDSQKELIDHVSRLELWAEHLRALRVVAPDPELPPAVNIFDIGSAGGRERERRVNAALELVTYVFGNLMDTQMTPKQLTLFRYAVRACLATPGATILTLRSIVTDKAHAPDLARLDPQTRHFFDKELDKSFDRTRDEIGWRLSYLLENPVFRAMFAAPSNRFDLYKEIEANKVILIDTDKDLLGEDRTRVFGRFFIALLMQATRHRAALDPARRKPVYCYIDEAHDYISHDPYITTLLDQARKQNVCLTIAHQRCGQLSEDVRGALANAAIKYAAGTEDSRAMARHLRCEPEFIETRPRGRFAVHVRNHTARAVSMRVPFGVLEALPRMDAEDHQVLRRWQKEQLAAVKPARSVLDEPDGPSAEAAAPAPAAAAALPSESRSVSSGPPVAAEAPSPAGAATSRAAGAAATRAEPSAEGEAPAAGDPHSDVSDKW